MLSVIVDYSAAHNARPRDTAGKQARPLLSWLFHKPSRSTRGAQTEKALWRKYMARSIATEKTPLWGGDTKAAILQRSDQQDRSTQSRKSRSKVLEAKRSSLCVQEAN